MLGAPDDPGPEISSQRGKQARGFPLKGPEGLANSAPLLIDTRKPSHIR